MFETILFATTATPVSEPAAEVTQAMCGCYGSQVHIHHVLAVPSRAFSHLLTHVRTGEEVTVDEAMLASAEAELKELYSDRMRSCPSYTASVSVGHPHREILRAAREQGSDLIILGATTRDDRAPHRRGYPGSTLQKVAHGARCPILTVSRAPAKPWEGISTIVFGADLTRTSDAAFGYASELAGQRGCALHIFHCLDLSPLHVGISESQESIEEKMDLAREAMAQRYKSGPEGSGDTHLVVREGVPYVEIVKFAREVRADLVVMGYGKQDLQMEEACFGSTMEQVLLRASCPVLSVNRNCARTS